MELPLLHPDIPVNETNAAQAREKVGESQESAFQTSNELLEVSLTESGHETDCEVLASEKQANKYVQCMFNE